jgi:hypothetical protein
LQGARAAAQRQRKSEDVLGLPRAAGNFGIHSAFALPSFPVAAMRALAIARLVKSEDALPARHLLTLERLTQLLPGALESLPPLTPRR